MSRVLRSPKTLATTVKLPRLSETGSREPCSGPYTVCGPCILIPFSYPILYHLGSGAVRPRPEILHGGRPDDVTPSYPCCSQRDDSLFLLLSGIQLFVAAVLVPEHQQARRPKLPGLAPAPSTRKMITGLNHNAGFSVYRMSDPDACCHLSCIPACS
jgi:hypothetical protein